MLNGTCFVSRLSSHATAYVRPRVHIASVSADKGKLMALDEVTYRPLSYSFLFYCHGIHELLPSKSNTYSDDQSVFLCLIVSSLSFTSATGKNWCCTVTQLTWNNFKSVLLKPCLSCFSQRALEIPQTIHAESPQTVQPENTQTTYPETHCCPYANPTPAV